jgi:hypothetical protein
VYDRFHYQLSDRGRDGFLATGRTAWPKEDDKELDLSCDPRWHEAADRSRELKLKLDEDFPEHLTRKLLEELAWARLTFDSGLKLLRAVRRWPSNIRQSRT